MNKPSQKPPLTLEELPQAVKALADKLDEAQAALEHKQTNLSTLTAKEADLKDRVKEEEDKLESLQAKFKFASEAYDEKVKDSEDRLKELYGKADNALTLFKKTMRDAESIREDLATRTLAVEKREEAVSRKEKLLKDAEGQVAELHKYMKL